jgi:hypothetical protein
MTILLRVWILELILRFEDISPACETHASGDINIEAFQNKTHTGLAALHGVIQSWTQKPSDIQRLSD